MKKLLLLVVSLLVVSVVVAQEHDVDGKFLLDIGYGAAVTQNYSAVSLFNDATESYRPVEGNFFAGIKGRHSKTYYGIKVTCLGGNTIQPYEEKYVMTALQASSRQYFPLAKNIDVWFGEGVGVALLKNKINPIGGSESVNRFTASVAFDMGLAYKIYHNSYAGLSGGLFCMPVFKHGYDLPVGTVRNHNDHIFGYQLMLNVGVAF